MDTNNKDKSKALAVKYRWIGIVTVVIIIIAYSIYTGRPIQDISVSEDGVEVNFIVPVDQKEGTTVYSSSSSRENDPIMSEDLDWAITIPGEGLLPLSGVDILIEPGEDDPQNRHLELVRKALENGELNVKYEDYDYSGELSVWITSTEDKNGYYTYIYTTMYKSENGSIEIAFREAYKKDGIWLTQISTALKELLAMDGSLDGNIDSPVQLDRPRVKSVAQIHQALKNSKYELTRGQVSAIGLLNRCFVDGTITEAFINQVRNGGKTVSQEIGLTLEACYIFADFGYNLYFEEEYLGSKIFWEAMLILNHYDAYFYNAYGVNLENLNDLQGALKAYQKAVELDPENEDAQMNFKRLKENLSEND